MDENNGLMRRQRCRHRLEVIGMAATALGLLMLGATQLLSAGTGLDESLSVGGVVLAVVGAVMVLTAQPSRSDRQALAARETRRDRVQRGRARQLLALPFATVGMLIVATLGVWRIMGGVGDRGDLMFAALAAMLAWMVPVIMMGWDGGSRRDRKWLEDDLTREWRGRSMALGFLVLLAGMSGLYLVGLWRPDLAIVGFPAVLLGTGMVMGLRFAWLDHQAESDDA
tara:strand:- start:216 stop:893 length:678 start_codon:yes stop_codon:yes gene_type:complete